MLNPIYAALENAMSYADYRTMMADLVENGKTTGPNQSESMVHFTKMNEARMQRLDKTTKLTEDSLKTIEGLQDGQIWLVITEAWCGDAAQILPAINAMAEKSEKIDLKLVLRDEHPDLMDLYLTAGAKSIPIVVILDSESKEVLGSWGPRPEIAQQIILDWKAGGKKQAFGEVKEALQRWYNKDKSASIQREFLKTIENTMHQLS